MMQNFNSTYVIYMQLTWLTNSRYGMESSVKDPNMGPVKIFVLDPWIYDRRRMKCHSHKSHFSNQIRLYRTGGIQLTRNLTYWTLRDFYETFRY